MADDDDESRASQLYFSMDTHDHKRHASPKDPEGYYARLGVGTDATPAAIRHAFLTLSQAFHTDKHNDADEATRRRMNLRFQEIQESYDVLSDATKRAAYDHSGLEGTKRLALVPQTVNHKEDVLRVLDALEREANIRTTSKMLSASGSATLTFSLAHLFAHRAGSHTPNNSRRRMRRPEPTIEAFKETEKESSPGQPPTSKDIVQGDTEQNRNEHERVAEQHSNATHQTTSDAVQPQVTEEAPPTTTEIPPPSTPPPQQQQKPIFQSPNEALANVKLVELDGAETFVVVLPEEIQSRLRAAMRVATGGGGGGGSGGGARMTATAQSVGLFVGLLMALYPKRMAIQHTFHHSLSNQLDVAFKGEVDADPQKSNVAFSTTVKYAKDGITSFAGSVKVGFRSLSVWVQHQRNLTPLWSLRTRLMLLEENAFLQKLKFTLVRKLNQFMELTNTLTWSVVGGSFETSVVRAVSTVEHVGAQLSLSAGSASVALFRSTPCAPLSKLFGAKASDGDSSSMGGRVQQTIAFDPFTRRTNVQYELWLHYSRLCHLGVGISSLLPVALHPLSMYAFNDDMNNMCQVHLLYARGDHRISVPIIVFASKRVAKGLLWLIVPWTVYRVGGVLFKPLWLLSQARAVDKKRRAVKHEVLEAREAALLEQASLAKFAERNRVAEDAIPSGGLVIVNAKFGILSPQIPVLAVDAIYPLEMDVTTVLQNMVQGSALSLPEGPKSHIAGFYDVDPVTTAATETRQLKVLYWYRRVRHSVVIAEGEALQLPQEAHREQDATIS